MQYTYSDLFDILSFFDGSPDGTIPGRDVLAEEIASQGRQFAMDKLR
jgi:beta-1,2-xylosyltransferase